MSASAYMGQAKDMAGFLLAREHRGPGDTIEAAAYRVQTKHGVPVATLLRLRHRDVKDMLLSSFVPLAIAYQTVKSAGQRIEDAYHHEKQLSTNSALLRVAAFVAGEKDQA